MAVTSTTLAGVNVWQFSGAVTDAEIKTAWASLIVNNRYRPARKLYIDDTCSLVNVRGTYYIDAQNLGVILHSSRNKANTVFTNWIFTQTTGLSVGARGTFVQFTNGTVISTAFNDGIDMKGGGMIYAVVGNPGGGDPRYLNEMNFGSLDGTIITSQAFAEQELQPVSYGTIWKGLNIQKCANIPVVNQGNQVVYRTNFNTEILIANPISLYASSNGCFISTVMRKQGATFTSSLANTFGTIGIKTIMLLNNWQDESYFGASKTTIVATNWTNSNRFIGGVLKKIQVQPSTLIRVYDSRSTTASQKSTFSETTNDFLDGTDSTTSNATTGRASIVCVGAIATGAARTIVRYTGQRFTLQKFGYKVQIETPDMTFGDDDLSAFSPITMTEQSGISRTESAITAATTINNFQELLEELHVLAIGLSGSQSYNGYNNGNLFDFTGTELKTNFTTVNVDATASSKISYNSTTNTLTIKASNLVSNSVVNSWNNSVGTINLLNAATIQGVYQDITGTSTTLEISGFDAGSAVYVEDNTFAQKFYSASATGTVTVYIPPTATGSWYYAVEKYGNQRQSDFFTFSGGLKTIVVKALPDVAITQATVGTVAAYTALNNPDKIYDYVAYLRLSVPHISYGQIVSKDGTALNLVDADLLVNQSFASVAEFDYDNKLLTIKSTSLETGVTFNLIKTSPPATIEANTSEVISVNLEDANGDSSVTIQGGSGNFTLWKITNATPEDNYATGTNLGNVGNVIYRFLSNNTHKIVIRDNTTGFRQVVTMAKGNYIKGLFFGDQVQLAQSAEVTEINNKVDVVLVDLDAKLDVAISTRATAQQVWEYTTRTLTSAGSSGATLAEIEASTILAKEATSQAIKAKTDKMEFNAQNHIAANVHQLQAGAISDIQDGLATQVSVDALPTLAEMESEDSNLAKNDLLNGVYSIANSTDATLNGLAGVDFDGMTDSLSAISDKIDLKPSLSDIENSTILAKETSVQDVKTKVDTLENTDLTGIEADLTIINENVKDASLLIPANRNL